MDHQAPHHAQDRTQVHEEGNSSGGAGAGKSSFLCRQSTTRWIPTSDQVRILKDLYYNNGIRSPSAEQIQRISARLRQYGKIEGKNVFYWFQNHKARERQKKRLTADIPMQKGGWKTEDSVHKYTTVPTGFVPSSPSSSSSPALLGWAPTFMEKSFRDCSISGGCGGGYVGNNNYGGNWVGAVDSSPATRRPVARKYYTGSRINGEVAADVETLQLFPMHTTEENIAGGFCGGTWFVNDGEEETSGNCSTMLELSLGGAHEST